MNLEQHPHRLFFLLSDPTRLRILCLLQQQSLCVTDLTEIIGALQPAISNHLKKLVKHGLVYGERNHRWVTYSLAQPSDRTTAAVLRTLAIARRKSKRLIKDGRRLKSKTRR
jgi:ArsR family transcriptional regulator